MLIRYASAEEFFLYVFHAYNVVGTRTGALAAYIADPADTPIKQKEVLRLGKRLHDGIADRLEALAASPKDDRPAVDPTDVADQACEVAAHGVTILHATGCYDHSHLTDRNLQLWVSLVAIEMWLESFEADGKPMWALDELPARDRKQKRWPALIDKAIESGDDARIAIAFRKRIRLCD